MLEMTCALVLMAVLLVVFSSILSRLNQTRSAFARETRAILVMQNTIQRLKLEAEPTRADAERIFREEARSVETLEPQVTATGDSLKLALLNRGRAATVEVTLKCAK